MNTSPKTHRNDTETKQILTLAIPAIIAQLAQMGMGVIDTIMAGHHSAEALAAIAMSLNLMNPVIILIIGILLPLNPMIAQLNGKQHWQQIGVHLQSGMALALLLTVPCFFIIRNFNPLFPIIGLEEAVIPIANGYLSAYSWGLPGLFLFLALRFANEGLFSTKAIMQVALSALPLNVGLNYWFMYGGLGIEAMGAIGVGWATTVLHYYLFIVMLLFTMKTSRYRHIDIFGLAGKTGWLRAGIASCKSRVKLTVIKEIITLGVPMGISIGLEVSLFAAVGIMIGSYGTEQIAGHQIAVNIASLSYMMPLGLSIAITARVGFHIGRDKPLEAKSVGYLGIIMALLIMIFNATIFISFPMTLASIYSNDIAVATIASQLLVFAAIFQLSDGIQVVAIGALRGMKDTKIPVLISIIAYWLIGFPAGYWFAEVQGYGVKGYWIAMISGLFLAAIMMTGRFMTLINIRTRDYLRGK